MSKEERSAVTITIPKFFSDMIDKYIEAHREEMVLLGHRQQSKRRQKALYEFLKKEGIIPTNK